MGSTIAAGHRVRHARHPHDPGLHLLLDVRVPAHRRRDVGARRPDGPRVPARRDRRPHHADRRGPAAQRRALGAARLGQPGLRRLRRAPGPTSWRHRQGRAAPDVRVVRRAPRGRGHLLLPDRVQRAVRPARRRRPTSPAAPRRWSAASCAACTGTPDAPPELREPRAGTGAPQTERPRAQILASGVALRWALEAQKLLAEDWGVGAEAWSATSWTELRRDAHGLRRVEPAAPRRRPARARTSPARWPTTTARSSR